MSSSSMQEPSPTKKYSRAEWSQLSIQERIRAMNETFEIDDSVPNLAATPNFDFAAMQQSNPFVSNTEKSDSSSLNDASKRKASDGTEQQPEMEAFNIYGDGSPCPERSTAVPEADFGFSERSSVVDVWRKREVRSPTSALKPKSQHQQQPLFGFPNHGEKPEPEMDRIVFEEKKDDTMTFNNHRTIIEEDEERAELVQELWGQRDEENIKCRRFTANSSSADENIRLVGHLSRNGEDFKVVGKVSSNNEQLRVVGPACGKKAGYNSVHKKQINPPLAPPGRRPDLAPSPPLSPNRPLNRSRTRVTPVEDQPRTSWQTISTPRTPQHGISRLPPLEQPRDKAFISNPEDFDPFASDSTPELVGPTKEAQQAEDDVWNNSGSDGSEHDKGGEAQERPSKVAAAAAEAAQTQQDNVFAASSMKRTRVIDLWQRRATLNEQKEATPHSNERSLDQIIQQQQNTKPHPVSPPVSTGVAKLKVSDMAETSLHQRQLPARCMTKEFGETKNPYRQQSWTDSDKRSDDGSAATQAKTQIMSNRSDSVVYLPERLKQQSFSRLSKSQEHSHYEITGDFRPKLKEEKNNVVGIWNSSTSTPGVSPGHIHLSVRESAVSELPQDLVIKSKTRQFPEENAAVEHDKPDFPTSSSMSHVIQMWQQRISPKADSGWGEKSLCEGSSMKPCPVSKIEPTKSEQMLPARASDLYIETSDSTTPKQPENSVSNRWKILSKLDIESVSQSPMDTQKTARSSELISDHGRQQELPYVSRGTVAERWTKRVDSSIRTDELNSEENGMVMSSSTAQTKDRASSSKPDPPSSLDCQRLATEIANNPQNDNAKSKESRSLIQYTSSSIKSSTGPDWGNTQSEPSATSESEHASTSVDSAKQRKSTISSNSSPTPNKPSNIGSPTAQRSPATQKSVLRRWKFHSDEPTSADASSANAAFVSVSQVKASGPVHKDDLVSHSNKKMVLRRWTGQNEETSCDAEQLQTCPRPQALLPEESCDTKGASDAAARLTKCEQVTSDARDAETKDSVQFTSMSQPTRPTPAPYERLLFASARNERSTSRDPPLPKNENPPAQQQGPSRTVLRRWNIKSESHSDLQPDEMDSPFGCASSESPIDITDADFERKAYVATNQSTVERQKPHALQAVSVDNRRQPDMVETSPSDCESNTDSASSQSDNDNRSRRRRMKKGKPRAALERWRKVSSSTVPPTTVGCSNNGTELPEKQDLKSTLPEAKPAPFPSSSSDHAWRDNKLSQNKAAVSKKLTSPAGIQKTDTHQNQAAKNAYELIKTAVGSAGVVRSSKSSAFESWIVSKDGAGKNQVNKKEATEESSNSKNKKEAFISLGKKHANQGPTNLTGCRASEKGVEDNSSRSLDESGINQSAFSSTTAGDSVLDSSMATEATGPRLGAQSLTSLMREGEEEEKSRMTMTQKTPAQRVHLPSPARRPVQNKKQAVKPCGLNQIAKLASDAAPSFNQELPSRDRDAPKSRQIAQMKKLILARRRPKNQTSPTEEPIKMSPLSFAHHSMSEVEPTQSVLRNESHNDMEPEPSISDDDEESQVDSEPDPSISDDDSQDVENDKSSSPLSLEEEIRLTENVSKRQQSPKSALASEYTPLRMLELASYRSKKSEAAILYSPVQDCRNQKGMTTSPDVLFSNSLLSPDSSVLSGQSSGSRLASRAERVLHERRKKQHTDEGNRTALHEKKLQAKIEPVLSQGTRLLSNQSHPSNQRAEASDFKLPVTTSSDRDESAQLCPQSSTRLSSRYNTADRFLEPAPVAVEEPSQIPDRISGQSFASDSIGTTSSGHSMESASSESESNFRQREADKYGKRKKRNSRRDKPAIESECEPFVSEKFSAASAANVEAFKKACESMSMSQVAKDWAIEMGLTYLQKVATDVNESVMSFVTSKMKQSKSVEDEAEDEEEDIAIEVEYMGDSAEDDTEPTNPDRSSHNNGKPYKDGSDRSSHNNRKPYKNGTTKGSCSSETEDSRAEPRTACV